MYSCITCIHMGEQGGGGGGGGGSWGFTPNFSLNLPVCGVVFLFAVVPMFAKVGFDCCRPPSAIVWVLL